MKTKPITSSGVISFLFIASVDAKETSTTIKILVEDSAQYVEDSPYMSVKKKRTKHKTETTITEQKLHRGSRLGRANICQVV